MVHGASRFKEFIRPGSVIVDAKTSTEALFSIQLQGREQVDQWLEKAVEAGGSLDPFTMKDHGKDMGMYSRSFADVDGHIWEVMTMLADTESQE
jgi:predicted lactoylglutathione lyase